MRVLFAGTPHVAIESLEAIAASGLDVVAVLTRPDAPLGRRRVLTPSPVAARAAELGLPVIKSDRVDQPVQSRLADLDLGAAAIVAYGAIVPLAALDIPANGWVNLHFSLLPAWRGAAPVQHAVINGDRVTGASTFRLEQGLDTGPVFGTISEPIRPEDTSGDLLDRLSHRGAELLVRALADIQRGQARPAAQHGPATAAPKLSLEDGRIRWEHSAVDVRSRINGVTPEPGAWTVFAGERFKAGPVRLREDRTDLAPGQGAAGPDGVLAGTATCAVQFGMVQPAGRKMMAAQDWARGVSRELVFG
jgi:methionyl-tRNA formyltransferase